MGASGWSYYVPYQADVNKALQELRQQVFESGDYYKPWESEFAYEDEQPEENPQTIEELIEMNATEGTHSIIDMEGAYLEPLPEGEKGEFGTVYPLSTEDLLDIFGTTKPARELIENIEQAEDGLFSEYAPGPWTGIYVTFYQGDTPDGYFFSGYSGD